MKPVIENVRKATKETPAVFTVKVGGAIIGLLEKYKNTRTDAHPWKAFAGHGKATRFLGSFYPEEGGQPAAVQAVLMATAPVAGWSGFPDRWDR